MQVLKFEKEGVTWKELWKKKKNFQPTGFPHLKT